MAFPAAKKAWIFSDGKKRSFVFKNSPGGADKRDLSFSRKPLTLLSLGA